MALICYYYCDKATDLLNHRKGIMIFLKTFVTLGMLTILSEGTYIMYDLSFENAARNLCKTLYFKVWRYLSLFLSIVFSCITHLIKTKIGD